METKDIFEQIKIIIEESIGTPADTIELDDTLFGKLGIDSIDFVDILFELENFYNIELKVSDIEARAKEELGEIPYEINGILTPEGIESIKKYMPEINPTDLKEGLSVHELVQLFTVHSLCKIVQYRLDQLK